MAKNERIVTKKAVVWRYWHVGRKKMWYDKLANFFRNVCVGL